MTARAPTAVPAATWWPSAFGSNDELDTLSHLQMGDHGYNGWTVAELAGTAGVMHLGAENGVFVVENLDTAPLADAGVREFALILTHPRLRGATGAWTSPIALV